MGVRVHETNRSCGNPAGNAAPVIVLDSNERKGPMQVTGNEMAGGFTKQELMKQLRALERKRELTYGGAVLGGIMASGGAACIMKMAVTTPVTEVNVIVAIISASLVAGGIKLTLYSLDKAHETLDGLFKVSDLGFRHFGNRNEWYRWSWG